MKTEIKKMIEENKSYSSIKNEILKITTNPKLEDIHFSSIYGQGFKTLVNNHWVSLVEMAYTYNQGYELGIVKDNDDDHVTIITPMVVDGIDHPKEFHKLATMLISLGFNKQDTIQSLDTRLYNILKKGDCNG